MFKKLLSAAILTGCFFVNSTKAQTISITASTSDTICTGTMVTFAATATGGTHYQWLKNSIHVGVDSPHYSTSGLANGDVIQCELLNAPAGAMIALSGPIVMTVEHIPGVGTISGPSTVCRFATISLSDDTAGGVWNTSNPFRASVSSSGVVTGLSVGVDTITYTISNLCGTAVASLSLTINTTPFLANITGPNTICNGASGTFIDSPLVGTWSLYDSVMATLTGGGTVAAHATGVDTIYYTATNGCGSTVRKRPFGIIVAPVAQPITGPNTVCEGDTIHLRNLVPGGNWHSLNNPVAGVLPGGGGGPGGATAIIHGNAAGMATIVYTVANACGADSSSINITVNPLPIVYPIIGKDSVCPGSTISLFEYTTGGVWSTKNASLATVDASGNVTGVAAGIDSIFYAVTNSCGTVTQGIRMAVYCPVHVGVQMVTGAAGINIYPNPAESTFTVSGVDAKRIEVANVYGQMVKVAANTNSVQVSELAAGIYYVTIFDENGTIAARQKLMKR